MDLRDTGYVTTDYPWWSCTSCRGLRGHADGWCWKCDSVVPTDVEGGYERSRRDQSIDAELERREWGGLRWRWFRDA